MAAAVLLAVTALGVVTILGLEVEEDITALMPSDGDGPSMAGLAEEWGLMKRVVVVIGPFDEGDDRMAAACDSVAAVISSTGGVESVLSSVDIEEARRAAGVIMERGVRLYRGSEKEMSGEEISRRLDALKERLASPEALVMQQYLLADPLGMSTGALAGLESVGTGMGATTRGGRIVSLDGRYAAIFARIGFDPMDVAASSRFVRELDRGINEAMASAGAKDVGAVALGGPHFAASSSSVIIADVQLAFALTAAGVILIFFLFFRRGILLAAALLPAGMGIAVALGVHEVAGIRLHALTLGFAAAITGISVDYAIHLLYRAAHDEGGEEESSRRRMAGAARDVARPVALGCATTVAAFVLVATSGFPGIRQLAVFAAISLPVALATTLLLLPAFHGFLLGRGVSKPGIGARMATWIVSRSPGSRSGRWVIGGIFGALLAASAYLGSTAALSGDPRDLGHVDPELKRRERIVEDTFPGVSDQALLVAGGGTLEEALERNDALMDALLGAGIGRDRILSLSPFLPSERTQERSLAAARGILSGRGRATGALFEAAGFKPEYFDSLVEGLAAGPITAEDYRGTSLAGLIDEAVHRSDDGWNVLTRVRAGTDAEHEELAGLARGVEGCAMASSRLEARAALERMVREVAVMLGIWLAAALVLLGLVQRSALFGLKAALPAVVGVASAVGVFAVIGRPVTPVACAGLTLVMGLGIDYGIFMQRGDRTAASRSAPAVLASAFTTIAAFGVLAMARTRAMADLGLVILIGVTVAVITSLVLLPSLIRGRREEDL